MTATARMIKKSMIRQMRITISTVSKDELSVLELSVLVTTFSELFVDLECGIDELDETTKPNNKMTIIMGKH